MAYTYQIIQSQLGGQTTQQIQRIQDSACIPSDSNNSDYRGYLAWVAAGNTAPVITQPSPPTATVSVTESEITNLQAQITALQAKVGISVSL